MNQGKIPYLNKVSIIGSIVRDPELRRTTAGVPVVNFRIASGRNNGAERDEVCYVGIVAWQDLAEICAAKLRKDDIIRIEGELRSRIRMEDNHTRRSYVEIRADQIYVLNRNNEMEALNGSGSISPEIPAEEVRENRPEPVAVISSENDYTDYSNYDYEENIL